jgi:hypothetical protein
MAMTMIVRWFHKYMHAVEWHECGSDFARSSLLIEQIGKFMARQGELSAKMCVYKNKL